MKKVTASPRILDVVGMQGAQRLLERLADMLAKIQKVREIVHLDAHYRFCFLLQSKLKSEHGKMEKT